MISEHWFHAWNDKHMTFRTFDYAKSMISYEK